MAALRSFFISVLTIFLFTAGSQASAALPAECAGALLGGTRLCVGVTKVEAFGYIATDLGLPGYKTGLGPDFRSVAEALDDYTHAYFGPDICSYTSPQKDGWTPPDKGESFATFDVTVEVAYGGKCSKMISHDVIVGHYVGEKCPGGWEIATADDGTHYCREPIVPRVSLQKNLGTPQVCEGNPCNVANGNKFQREVDYVGRNIGGLEFVRYYNSKTGGWTNSYSSNLVRKLTGNLRYPSIVFAQRADGRVIRFFENSDGVFASAPDVNDRLLALRDSARKIVGWKLVTEEDVTEEYDAAGRLASLSDRAGLERTVLYEPMAGSTVVKSVTDAFGRQLVFVNDSFGRAKTLTDPANNTIQFEYDSLSRLSTVTYPGNQIRTYLYNEPAFTSGTNLPGALTGIIDENATRYATWTYDKLGNVKSSEHANGIERVSLEYLMGPEGEPTTTVVTDASGYTRTYTLAITNEVAKVEALDSICDSCSDDAVERVYDENGNLVERLDRSDQRTIATYDPNRNLPLSSEVNGRRTEMDWHPRFRLPTQIRKPNHVSSYVYDDATGTLTSVTETDSTEGLNRVTTFVPNAKGQITHIDGPRTDASDFTDFTYDAEGNVKTVKNALGHVTEFTTYDRNGNNLSMKDPNGLITTATYDGRGNLKSRKVGQELTTYSYDNAGQLHSVSLPSGELITYGYDGGHRLIDIRNAAGEHVHYTLDDVGNQKKSEVFDAYGKLTLGTRAEFDRYNRIQAIIQNGGQETKYETSASGRLTSVTDPLSRQTTYRLDAFDRVEEVTNPDQSTVKSEYTDNDQLRQLTNGKDAAVTYSVNSFGDVKAVESRDPDAFSKVRGFDNAGNLLWKQDFRGIKTTYSHDALNRLKSISAPGATIISFGYDAGLNAKGRLTSIVDESGTTNRSYNAQGRVEKVTRLYNGLTIATGYSYDTAGRLTGITYPSGRILTYRYDKERIVGVEFGGAVVANQIKYMPFAGASGWQWGNGQAYARTYDLDGRLASFSMGASRQEIVRDDAGNIKTISDTADATHAQKFDYDSLDRVTDYFEGNSISPTEHFEYDKNGNRRAAVIAGKAYSYGYFQDSDFLATVSGPVAKQWQPDPTGSIISDGTHVFQLDAFRRIASVSVGTLKVTYLRSGLQQRVSKRGSDGTTTHFVYDEAGKLLAELDKAGNTLVEHIWLGDQPVAVAVAGTLNYVFSDHLNTPRLITDTSGRARWTWRSNPFGSTQANGNPAGLGQFTYNPRFAGQYFDAESGLHYNYFRDYDPQTGRYVQSDPIGLRGGINTYGYVRGNPVGRVDPLGLVDIYVGGAGDGTTKIVSSWVDKNASGSPYFEWTQGSELSEYISKVPANETINLYGHSYGGDTAAWAAMRAGGRVNSLTTLDPVSHIKPDFKKLRCSVGTWRNVNAAPSQSDRTDTIAWWGGKWGAGPRGIATSYAEANVNHGDFGGLMKGIDTSGSDACECPAK